MPNMKDTGLHLSMRLLLGIIAGLLISDMLKATVKRIIGDAPVCCSAWPDVLVACGALLFLGRLVVDNVLYYHERDPATRRRSYPARVTLISVDLVSYALCYATVALLEPGSPFVRITTFSVVMSLFALTLVEVLHFVWCQLVISLPYAGRAHRGQLVLLRKWRSLSARSAVAGAISALFMWRSYEDEVLPHRLRSSFSRLQFFP